VTTVLILEPIDLRQWLHVPRWFFIATWVGMFTWHKILLM